MGNPASPDSAADYVNTVATQLPAGAVESVEGSNEWDLFGGGDPLWAVNLLSRQRELYQASKANPATADLPVLSPALAFKWNYATAGDVSRVRRLSPTRTCTPAATSPPTRSARSPRRCAARSRPSRWSRPRPATTTPSTRPTATCRVPEDVAGVYTPRVLLEHFLKGEKRVYTYELLDEFDDPGKTNPEANFGLLHRDLSPKPAYTAMKNLLGLLSDPGPAFTPDGAAGEGDRLSRATASTSSPRSATASTCCSCGATSQIYDPATKQPHAGHADQRDPPARQDLEHVKVYRPRRARPRSAQTQGTSVPLQMDGSVTAITIDPIPAPAPTSVTATAGQRHGHGELAAADH